MAEEKVVALCTPCVMELRRKGRRLKEIPARREKVTCWLCDRRRYGLQYIMGDSRKGDVIIAKCSANDA